MIYQVNISEQADRDLRGIFEYISFHLKSLDNAIQQLHRLKKQILSLEDMPERYDRYKVEPWHSRGLRFMPVDHYVVFYISNVENQLVTILRVVYGGRDLPQQFNN